MTAPIRKKSTEKKRDSSIDGGPLDLNIQTGGEFYTEVFSWGSDASGQLGLGSEEPRLDTQLLGNSSCFSVPRFCSYNITIRQLSCGRAHAAFITRKSLAIFIL